MTHMQSLISVPYALAVVLTMKTNRLGSVLFNLTFICVGGLFFLVFVNAASLSVFAAWPLSSPSSHLCYCWSGAGELPQLLPQLCVSQVSSCLAPTLHLSSGYALIPRPILVAYLPHLVGGGGGWEGQAASALKFTRADAK